MWQRVRTMLVKEFIQMFRDPRMRMVIFVVPVIQLIVIGYAVTTDVRHVSTAVYDLDNSVASRALVAQFTGSETFDVVARITDDRQMVDLLDRGRVSVVLRFPHGFSGELERGGPAEVQMVLDGTDSNTASIAMGYASRILSEYNKSLLIRRFTRLRGPFQTPGRIGLRSRAWFNENLVSRNYFVPGVIVIILTLVTLLLTSMAVVREKEIGTMEQIMVTPIRSIEFVLGKTLPFALIGYANLALVTVVGVFWFEVPIRGSIGLLAAASTLYMLTALSAGLLISTVSQTQQQAMMTTFFVYFPAILLSGFMFPIANMPPAIQWLTVLNPMRYFLVIVRGIFLKGVGVEVLWPQLAALAVMGAVTLSLVAAAFRKTA